MYDEPFPVDISFTVLVSDFENVSEKKHYEYREREKDGEYAGSEIACQDGESEEETRD